MGIILIVLIEYRGVFVWLIIFIQENISKITAKNKFRDSIMTQNRKILSFWDDFSRSWCKKGT